MREDVRFASEGEECAAWLWAPPAGDAPAPCVVLGHGIGVLKEGRLDAYAERFNAAGYAALAFDYRHLGGSGGQPRQLVDIGRQHADWRAAVTFARGVDGIDPDRIAAWGSSLSGGHVIHLAAEDGRLAAAIAQVPHTDGIATLRQIELRRILGLTALGLIDQARSLLGRSPRYVPTVGPPGSISAMTGDDAQHGYAAIYPEGSEWPNELAARIVLRIALYSPGRESANARCPILFQVGTDDHITPPAAALKAAERAPYGELITYPIRHFDIYRGEPFERAVADQLEFLSRHLPV
jgi:fermentation-respiration switch protein FrsA (DUF1100 family)